MDITSFYMTLYHTMSVHSLVVGEGSFGCVHTPPLKCKNARQVIDESKVSKILKIKNANDELKEFGLIGRADKGKDFHLGLPNSCEPDDNPIIRNSVNKCQNFSGHLMKDYKLLLLENGGMDFAKFENKYAKMHPTTSSRRALETFWLDMSRMFHGLLVLQEKGMIHKDTKPQNMVYNEDTGRSNFIDFGLMTTKRKFMNTSFISNWWSRPPETELLGKNEFTRFAVLNENKRREYIDKLRNVFLDKHYALFHFIYNRRLDGDIGEFLQNKLIELRHSLGTVELSEKDAFRNASIDTFDSYGVGMGLLSIINNTYQHLGVNKDLFDELKQLFTNMVNWNPFARYTPKQCMEIYKDILEKHGLLEKYDMRFEKDLLVKGRKAPIKLKKLPRVVRSDKLKGDDMETISIQPSILDIITKKVKECPNTKEINPKTGRCVTKCKDNYTRNAQFKCVKNKTIKRTVSEEKKEKVCPITKEINPKTGRCVTKCKDNYTRNAQFKCVKK